MDKPENETRLIEVGLVVLLLVGLVIRPSTFRFWGRTSLGILILLIAGFAVWNVWRRGASVPKTATRVGLLVLGGYAVSILFAVNPRFALESAIVPLTAVALAVGVAAIKLGKRAAAAGIVVAGAVIAVLTLIDWFGQSLAWIQTVQAVDPSLTLLDSLPVAPPRATPVGQVHPNNAVVALYVSGAVAAASMRDKESRLFASVALGLIVLAMLATGSRAGVIAGMMGVVISVALANRQRMRSFAWVKWLGVVVALFAAAVLAAWLAGFRPEFLFRSTLTDRFPVMALGFDMFLDRPWVGNGPGAFRPLFPVFSPDLYPGVDARLIWTSAHNTYVQLLLEIGLIGVSLVVSAVGYLAFVVWRGFARLSREYAVLAAGFLGAGAAFLVQGLVDSLNIGAPLLFMAVLAGIVLGGVDAPLQRSGRGGRLLFLAPILVVPLLVLATIGAHLAYLEGRNAVLVSNWTTAENRFRSAFEADPLPVYAEALSYAQAQAGTLSTETAVRIGGWPEPPSIALNLAAVSDGVEASILVAEVRPKIVGDEVGLIQAGSLDEGFGFVRDAADQYSKAIRINPWLSSSPFLDKLAPSLRGEVLDKAFWDDACVVGDEWILSTAASIEQVEYLASECDPWSVASQLARIQIGGASDVLAEANASVLRSPDSLELRRTAGIAALESGLVQEARDQLVVGALLGDSYSAWLLTSTYPSVQIPAAVQQLAASLEVGYSPVLLASAPMPVYRFGAVSMGAVGGREGLPSPLSDGLWQSGYTTLHESFVSSPGLKATDQS